MNSNATSYSAYRLGTGGLNAQLRCGLNIRKESFETDFRTEQFALLYVFRGCGDYRDEYGRAYNFSGSCAILRLPGCRHSLRITAEAEIAYFAMPAEVYQMLKRCDLIKSAVFVSGAPPEQIRARHREIYEAMRTCADTRLFEIIVMMQELAALICTPQREDAILEACRLIEHRSDASIDLKQIASELHMSYSLFRRRFREETGISPGKYHIIKKLEKASWLLGSGHSVGEVAEALGYSDIYTFSRQFRKYTGEMPSKFKGR